MIYIPLVLLQELPFFSGVLPRECPSEALVTLCIRASNQAHQGRHLWHPPIHLPKKSLKLVNEA